MSKGKLIVGNIVDLGGVHGSFTPEKNKRPPPPVKDKVWIVGRVLDYKSCAWEFQGVFSSPEKAITACKNENWFVGEAVIDQGLPIESCEWINAHCPCSIQS